MFTSVLEEYQSPESKLGFIDGYTAPQFSNYPFSSQPALRFEIPLVVQKASLQDLMGFISTTSSFQNYMEKHGEAQANALLTEFKSQIATKIGGDTTLEELSVDITFPYFILLNRKDVGL
uniref:Uncharacterized protein n=1 Tax=Graphocephala atropunctata TaxID=36148 RepID=A0A1B6KMA2_9HEMI